MRILVKDKRHQVATGGRTEWIIIELQGTVYTNNDTTIFDGLRFGKLSYDKKGNPELIVGKHQLKGKVVSLKKPFAVMLKHKETDDSTPEYHVHALVKKKLIFSTRPKPLITKG